MSLHLISCYRGIPSDGKVLDIGCANFRQVGISRELGLYGIRHYGVDYCAPGGELPDGYCFRMADLDRVPVPFEDDMFDLVVASHVMEHLSRPVEFFGECARVCKPGGLMYFETPSERSLFLPGMPLEHDKFFSLSFYDDPTHASRPWTPQSLHRLTRYFSCEPLQTGYLRGPRRMRWLFPLYLLYAWLRQSGKLLEIYCWAAVGWASFLVARKPSEVKGKPPFRYYIPTDR